MKIKTGVAAGEEPTVRGFGEVLGLVDGPSKRGSTVYKRARVCARENALIDIAGLRVARPDTNLTIGSIYHHALEAYYRAQYEYQFGWGRPPEMPERDKDYLWGKSREWEHAAWDSIAPFENEPGYEEIYQTVQRCLGAYFEHYRNRDPWRIHAVEETMEYDGPTFLYTARVDGIVERYDTGGWWVLEHKTAKSINASLEAGYAMDLQMLGQFWLAKTVLHPDIADKIRGVLVNIVTKHKTPQFLRVEVIPPDDQLTAFEQYLEAWTAQQQLAAEQGYPLSFGNCVGPVRWFKTCAFYDVCRAHPLKTVEQFAAEPPPYGFRREGEENQDND